MLPAVSEEIIFLACNGKERHAVFNVFKRSDIFRDDVGNFLEIFATERRAVCLLGPRICRNRVVARTLRNIFHISGTSL